MFGGMRTIMRLLGYALILIGFAAISWKVLHVREITIAVTAESLQRIPEQESYDRTDLKSAAFQASRDTWSASVPGLWQWSILIVAGGILLDLRARRPLPNQTLQATAAPPSC
jgi:hypothetical protein